MLKYLLIYLVALFSTIQADTAVVFDFGGVMTGEANRQAVIEFLQDSFNLTYEEFREVQQLKKQANSEGMTDMEFWLLYAQNEGITLSRNWVNSFKEALLEGVNPNEEMFAFVEELKEKNIRVALLSNISHRLAAIIDDFGLYNQFDPCILSCEIGVEKPDQRAYEILLKQLQLPPQQIIFIDDKIENVEAAKDMGIDAVLFRSPEQVKEIIIMKLQAH